MVGRTSQARKVAFLLGDAEAQLWGRLARRRQALLRARWVAVEGDHLLNTRAHLVGARLRSESFTWVISSPSDPGDGYDYHPRFTDGETEAWKD